MTIKNDNPVLRSKIAAGFISEAGYFNDMGNSSGGMAFKGLSETVSGFSGIAKTISSAIVNEDGYIPKETLGIKNDLEYTPEVEREIKKIAGKIVQLGKIQEQDAIDFLHILITIDCIKIMKKIAEICDIPELANEEILNKPMEILFVPHIEKVAFLADAISAIVRAYERFTGLKTHEGKTALTAQSVSDILESITGAAGLLFGGGGLQDSDGPINAVSSSLMLGLNLSKLLKGKEIPMSVQTNNPSLLPPSVIGERMFGQSSGFTFLNDFNQHVQKKLAIFDRPQGATGTQSFLMKNVRSMNKSQSLGSAISSVISSISSNDTSFEKMMNERASHHLPNILGGKLTETISLKHADSAIPFMKGMADILASSFSEKRPEMDNEMRSKVEYITSQINGVENLFKRGINKKEIEKNGLTKTSPSSSPLPINIDIISLFPTKLFQEGWNEMNYVQQEMLKDDDFYKYVMFILENLSVEEEEEEEEEIAV